jgi:hypothetical protein
MHTAFLKVWKRMRAGPGVDDWTPYLFRVAMNEAIDWHRARKYGNRYIGAVTGETSVAAGKTQTREGARYRRIARRAGPAKACVALGNTQMRVYHVLLSTPGMRYHDLGHDYYDQQRHTARQVSRHVGKLASLGYEVTLARIPEPAGPANPQAT